MQFARHRDRSSRVATSPSVRPSARRPLAILRAIRIRHHPSVRRPRSRAQGPRHRTARAADPRSTYLPSVQCAHCTEYGGGRRAPSTPTPVPEFHIPHTCMRKRDIWRRRPEEGGPIPDPRAPGQRAGATLQLDAIVDIGRVQCPVSSVQRAMCSVQCNMHVSRNVYLEKVAVRGAMYGVLILIPEV